ncbi:Uncharacterised protein [Vibrio cholerae]|nr:Uncharacterised protein [Vibrio cholerae]CSD09271.1 Uncharacterised protein [Vibrio cholerae]CSI62191.1 Uncharacterised protein [Vibrio cholerae]
MFIRFCGDTDGHIHQITVSPIQTLREVHGGDTCLFNQFTGIGCAMRNRNPITEIGGMLCFAIEHTLRIAFCH